MVAPPHRRPAHHPAEVASWACIRSAMSPDPIVLQMRTDRKGRPEPEFLRNVRQQPSSFVSYQKKKSMSGTAVDEEIAGVRQELKDLEEAICRQDPPLHAHTLSTSRQRKLDPQKSDRGNKTKALAWPKPIRGGFEWPLNKRPVVALSSYG